MPIMPISISEEGSVPKNIRSVIKLSFKQPLDPCLRLIFFLNSASKISKCHKINKDLENQEESKDL